MMNWSLVAFLFFILPLNEAAFPALDKEAEDGDDVLFQCQLDPQVSLESSLVEWRKDDRTNIVHVYRHGRDYLNDQKEEFKGRTVLFHEGLSRGNVTLQLSSVRRADSGTFRCYVQKQEACSVTLRVVQSIQTRNEDLRKTRCPELPEPHDPGVKNMAAVYAVVFFIIVVFCV